jgi:hypothetical protein
LGFGTLDQFGNKLIVDGLFDKKPTASATALALVEE